MKTDMDGNGMVRGDDGVWRPGWAAGDEMLSDYYDNEWNRPIRDEKGLYERLVLESFQSGLSWLTVLSKRPAFRKAFADFDPDVVAQYGPSDVDKLMHNADIIRNERKILAAITNAQAAVKLRDDGGLVDLFWKYAGDDIVLDHFNDLPAHTEDSAALTKELKSHGFVFVGPTTVFASMLAVGLRKVRVRCT